MIYHHNRTFSGLLHLNFQYESGYVVQYYKTGEFVQRHASEYGAPHRTIEWCRARVMSICDAEHYEHHYLEGCVKIRVKD